MDPGPLIDRILDDEGIAAGLDEADAIVLVNTLIDRVRVMAERESDIALVSRKTEALCQWARKIAEVVCARRDKGAAWALIVAGRLGLQLTRKHSSPSDLLRILVADMNMPIG
jgi:hypothetical protein